MKIPTQATLTVGDRVFTDLTNLKILYGSGGSTVPRSALRLPNGTSGYLPSGSNKFRVYAVVIIAGDGGPVNFRMSYGDNDVGFATNTAVTNQVWLAGASFYFAMTGNKDAGANALAVNFLVPNGKYTIFEGTHASEDTRWIAYGYEEA